MPPDTQQPISQPPPSESSNGNVHPAGPIAQTQSSVMPPRRGRWIMMLLLLIFMAGTGGFGYLWWKNRNVSSSATSTTSTNPSTTTSASKQTTTSSYAFSIGPKIVSLNLSLTADPSYRVQISNPLSSRLFFSATGLDEIFKVTYADGNVGSKASGQTIGEIHIVDLTTWLTRPEDPTKVLGNFAGKVSIADKSAALTKLQELIDKKESKIDPYLAGGPLNPFVANASNAFWRSPELLELGDFKGFSTIGMQLQNIGYAPESYIVLLGKVKGASSEDHTILVYGRAKLHDELSQELDKITQSNTAPAPSSDDKITSVTADIKKNDKYPADAEALHAKLVEVFKTLKIEATSK